MEGASRRFGLVEESPDNSKPFEMLVNNHIDDSLIETGLVVFFSGFAFSFFFFFFLLFSFSFLFGIPPPLSPPCPRRFKSSPLHVHDSYGGKQVNRVNSNILYSLSGSVESMWSLSLMVYMKPKGTVRKGPHTAEVTIISVQNQLQYLEFRQKYIV
jgi:hypothetical protein